MRLATLLLMALPACTFDEGRGFSTLVSAELSAEFEPGARAHEGDVLTSGGQRVRIERFGIHVDRVELQALEVSGSSAAFDPATPPAGYTLCHGGHCHAEDGRLVDYAEVEAGLAGGEARFVPVVTFPLRNEPFDLLAGTTMPLNEVLPSRELPRTLLRRVVLSVTRLELSGSIVDALATSAPLPLSVELTGSVQVASGTSLESSRSGPAEFRVFFSFEVDGTLFDNLDWTSLGESGEIRLTDPDSAAGRAVVASLVQNEVLVRAN